MDLFAPAAGFERLPLEHAEVSLWREFYAPERAQEVMQALMEETPWRQEAITLWGKQVLQPRLSAWYADPGVQYAYSGLALEAREWAPVIAGVRAEVEQASGLRFNSVLLNLYRDGQDSMGWHSDDERELGVNPAIASLSLGAARIFKFRRKSPAPQKPVPVELENGSLLLMAGATQHHWQHAIGKTTAVQAPRINLTFRFVTTLPRQSKDSI